MEKFRNKYRIPSTRLPNWNYGAAALYFITICTHLRVCYFGQVRNGQMHLSEIGKIVESEWQKTFEIRQDMNLWCGEFVVMPNHFHAIIGIGKNPYNTPSIAGLGDGDRRDAMHRVSTTTTTNRTDAMHRVCTTPTNQFGPQSKNLASIVRGFKSAVTMGARNINPLFQWQSRYHDHIIRNTTSFQKISGYIVNNPLKWNEDKFFNAE